jgi:hypothetical protein
MSTTECVDPVFRAACKSFMNHTLSLSLSQWYHGQSAMPVIQSILGSVVPFVRASASIHRTSNLAPDSVGMICRNSLILILCNCRRSSNFNPITTTQPPGRPLACTMSQAIVSPDIRTTLRLLQTNLTAAGHPPCKIHCCRQCTQAPRSICGTANQTSCFNALVVNAICLYPAIPWIPSANLRTSSSCNKSSTKTTLRTSRLDD